MAIPPPTETGRPPRKRLLLALVVVAVVVAGGLGAYFLLSAPPANRPPTATFTWSTEGHTTAFDASGSSDTDGTVTSHDWDFGDGATDTGISVEHTYAAAGTYTVTLTVADDDGSVGRKTEDVAISDQPVARFAISRDRMTVDVNASDSFAPAGSIAAYAWDWGDGGAAGSGMTATHTYATPGKYTVALTVTDHLGGTGTASRLTSVASTTIDVTLYDFFQPSYGEWWTLREPVYGDKLLPGPDNVVRTEDDPGVVLYPWAGDPTLKEDLFLYTLYRTSVHARNLPEFTLDNPVLLPTFGDTSVHGERVDVDWYMQYVDDERQAQLGAMGFPIQEGYMDGFVTEVQFRYRMDYNATRRFFNVSGDPVVWWAANTVPGPPQGPLEADWQAWYEIQGKQTFDIYSAFEWPYTMFQFNVNASVTPNPGGGNTTTLDVLLASWGHETLTARWFYWGTGSYPNGTPNPPSGWWGQENGWFEDFTFNGTLYPDHIDFDMDAILEYQFIAMALPGPDGQFGTSDDEPVWSWFPQLMDYIYSATTNPKSEMDRWRTGPNSFLTAINAHPGAKFYGQQYTIDQAFQVWDLRPGETITVVLPKTAVTFYDPVGSHWDASGMPHFVTFKAPMTLRRMSPAGVGVWDEATRTLTMAGPFDMGGTDPPFEGLPRVDIGPKR